MKETNTRLTRSAFAYRTRENDGTYERENRLALTGTKLRDLFRREREDLHQHRLFADRQLRFASKR